MKDQAKTKAHLEEEPGEVHQRLAELEVSKAEWKRTEEALREARDRLENLLDHANAPIIVWDPELKITRFNHAFERLTGRSSDEVLGAPLDILIPDEEREKALSHAAVAFDAGFLAAAVLAASRRSDQARARLHASRRRQQ